MTPSDFAYWLQGFAELSDGAPSEEQWTQIRDHLNLVFDKVTPNVREINMNPLPRKVHVESLSETRFC